MDDLDLVDLGQAHVDVQDVGALLLLADALAHDVVKVTVAQGLLQALFAGGIDALADDGDLVTVTGKVHDRLGARDRHAGLAVVRAGRVVIDKRAQGGHVRRRGAAAAAHDAHAVFDHAGDGLGVFGCLDVKDGIAVIVHAGQSRIGLHHDGLVGDGEHASGEPSELGRSLAAVDAQTSAPMASSVMAATSGLVPRKVRPSSSKVMVAKTGRSEFSRQARTAALISARSVIVSIIKRSTPAATLARTSSAKRS